MQNKILRKLKENEHKEEKQIKENIAKEKGKSELQLMEVRCKSQDNKIFSNKKREDILLLWKQSSQHFRIPIIKC